MLLEQFAELVEARPLGPGSALSTASRHEDVLEARRSAVRPGLRASAG